MSIRQAVQEVHMFRSSLSLTLVAAAAAAGLVSTPRLAAQSTPAPARPAVAETELGTADSESMRLLVNEQALHRDRSARIARLRTLAAQSGRTDRLAELDRLEQLEGQRFEARSLTARSRMSDQALRQADDFVRHGGTMKVRRANQADGGHQAERTRRPGDNSESMRAQKARRTQATTTRPGKSSTRMSGSSSRGRASAGGRSPR